MEEVGFDMKDRASEDQYLERDVNGQVIRLYIVKQVPLETKFAPKTKNEIKVDDPISHFSSPRAVSSPGDALVSYRPSAVSPARCGIADETQSAPESFLHGHSLRQVG